jgi:hypothetical protein
MRTMIKRPPGIAEAMCDIAGTPAGFRAPSRSRIARSAALRSRSGIPRFSAPHRTGGIVETIPEGMDGMEQAVNDIVQMTMLGRAATLEDVASAAVFAASDRARSMTATAININCGTIVD